MKCNPEEVISYSEKALKLSAGFMLSPREQEWLIKETVTAFKDNIEPDFRPDNNSQDYPENTLITSKNRGGSIIEAQGRRYLDCLGASSTSHLGNIHPVIINAVKKQLEQQTAHNLKLLPHLQAMLARIIAMIAPGELQYSFFNDSGKDALLGAVEVADRINSRVILKAINSNLLKTLKPQIKKRKPVGDCYSLPGPGILEVPFDDINSLEKAFKQPGRGGEPPGVFILEPICYEEGIIIPSQEYISEVYELCLQNKTLLVVDETKVGLARTGKLFAIEHYHIYPDILCLGSTLGGGIVSMGAFIASAGTIEKIKSCPTANRKTCLHSTISCAAAIATIQVILDEGLVEKAAEKGNYILPHLEKMVRKYPDLKDVRGKGLLIGLEFEKEEIAQNMNTNLFKHGILTALSSKKPSTLLIEPPLSIDLEDIDFLLETIELLIKKT